MYVLFCGGVKLGAPSLLGELGAPSFWVSKCKIKIKTLALLERP